MRSHWLTEDGDWGAPKACRIIRLAAAASGLARGFDAAEIGEAEVAVDTAVSCRAGEVPERVGGEDGDVGFNTDWDSAWNPRPFFRTGPGFGVELIGALRLTSEATTTGSLTKERCSISRTSSSSPVNSAPGISSVYSCTLLQGVS